MEVCFQQPTQHKNNSTFGGLSGPYTVNNDAVNDYILYPITDPQDWYIYLLIYLVNINHSCRYTIHESYAYEHITSVLGKHESATWRIIPTQRGTIHNPLPNRVGHRPRSAWVATRKIPLLVWLGSVLGKVHSHYGSMGLVY